MQNNKTQTTEKFFNAILKLENIDECYNFFEDICTIRELKEISQRLEVAMLLDQNMSYQEIAKASGASTATITRVKKALHYGSDGYKTIIERLKENEND